jgi:cell division septal protein FtsQ
VAKKRRKKKTTRRKKNSGSFWDIFTNKVFLGVISILIISGGLLYGLKYFFLDSQFFTIREVTINKEASGRFSSEEKRLNRDYKGYNIFSINLRIVRAKIIARHPHLRKVEVNRLFPDTLEVSIITRESAAYIDSGGGLAVDDEGIVLSRGESSKGLVAVKGINFFLVVPSRGEKVDNPALGSAITLIEGLNKRGLVRRYDITSVDVSDRKNMVISCKGVKIKMGADDFTWKINRLAEILRDPNISLSDINYIDLRFENAVISPK